MIHPSKELALFSPIAINPAITLFGCHFQREISLTVRLRISRTSAEHRRHRVVSSVYGGRNALESVVCSR